MEMSKLTHSHVLFSGDDGLPLEFNVRNTNDKSLLKAMIEHGGGLCTQSDNAVHLISPGTKVLNADLGKKLVSSRYIYDCVTQNYLLDVNDYVFTISEAETSDISDEDSLRGIVAEKSPEILEAVGKSKIDKKPSTTDGKVDYIDSSSSTPSKLNSTQQKSTASSNQSESFIEGSQDLSRNPRISAGVGIQPCEFIPLTSTAKEPDSMDLPDNFDIEKEMSPIQASASLVNPPKRTVVLSPYKEKNSAKQLSLNNKKILSTNPAALVGEQKETLFLYEGRDSSNEIFSKDADNLKKKSPNQNEGLVYIETPERRSCTFPRYERIEDSPNEMQVVAEVHEPPLHASPIHAAVSSSQPEMGDLDQFDNLLLSKAQQKVPSDDEDCLSQSYTVSSSADAQKPNSAEVNSAEMFAAGPSHLPDSPMHVEGLVNEQRSYIQRLEAEVEKILQKPSPKSIQDKICLVKYVCCVKKLSPASVLQSLQQL